MAHRRRPRSIVSAALAASALTTCGAGLALALALAGSGCEPAPEDATVTPSAPVLSTFTVAPDQLTVGVAVQLQGSVDVVDADGDLTELVFRMIPPSGTPSADLPMPVAAAGQTSGHVPFALDFTADAVGPHTLELRAKDAAGHVSDAVSASLTVSAVVAPTPHAPELSSVSFQPHDATVGSPVTLAGTVHVSDADGDATKVHLRVRAPGGVLSPETVVDATFDGLAGDVAFSLAYTPTVDGNHSLEAWAEDATGLLSSVGNGFFDASTPLPDAPTVADLALETSVITPGVAAEIHGSVSVSDPNADAATLVVNLDPPLGTSPPDLELPIDLGAAVTSGSVPFTVTVPSPVAGTYTVKVWALDAGQRRSNTVSATVLSSPVVPAVSALSFQPHVALTTVAVTITGSVKVVDPDGDLASISLRLRSPSGVLGAPLTLDPDVVTPTADAYPFSIPFTADAVGTWTLEATASDDAGHTAPAATGIIDVGDVHEVQDACAATGKDCTGQGFCYSVTDSTCDYLAARSLDLAACDEVGSTGSVAACVSSISDFASPWAQSDSNCDFVQYWSNPTDLPIDCRCPDSDFEDRCQRPYNLDAAVSFEDGPRVRDLAGEVHLHNGPVVGREWFVPAGWSTFNHDHQTLIFAFDLDSGDRRRVSGAYEDARDGYTELGAGPAFVNVLDMQLGQDGKLYAMGGTSDIAAPKVWRVDPASGDRTLLFDEETQAVEKLCPNGSTLPGRKVVQMVPEGWTMDAAGNHYFAIIGAPGPSIVKLPDDFSSCTYLTRVTTATLTTLTDNVGAGYDAVQFDFRALSIHGDKLYAVSDTKLIEVELATGRRRLMSNAKEVGGLGAGPINAEGLGHRWSRWDEQHQVLWTVGLEGGSQAVVVDLASGDRTTWPCWHPTMGLQAACDNVGMALVPGPLNLGGFAIDPLPPHDLFFAHDLFSIVRYETKTGNAYIFSL